MSRTAGSAGFTLIELIIALALFALIALAGAALVDSVLGVRARTEGRLERLAEIERAMFVLNEDLSQVTGGPIRGGGATLSFDRQGAGIGGVPLHVDYSFADGAILRITRSPASPGGGGSQRLLSGAAGLRWHFLAGRGASLDRWPPTPADAARWPAAIAAEIELAPDAAGPGGSLRRIVALPDHP